MDLNGTLSGEEIDVLTTVYLVSLTPSVIGSLSVLVVSILRWKHLKQQVHLLMQLALADLLAALILMSSSAMNRLQTDSSVTICQYILPLSLTCYFISFLLVVVYAWKSKNAIQGWRTRPEDVENTQNQCRRKRVLLPVYLIVWLTPIAIYLAYVLTPFIKTTPLIPDTNKSTILQNESKYCTSCILFLHVWRDSCSDAEIIHDTFIKVFLFLVVIPVMLSCSVIYYKVGKWYQRYTNQDLFPVEGDGQSRRRFKNMFSTAGKMVMVILFCWVPALVLILLSTLITWTNVGQRSLFGLYIIQAASVSLQGFLNSLVYAWRRTNFTEAVLGENTPLLAYTRRAFFEESLRSETLT
ncbi:transmembrane protein 116 [Cynoglossus semilaevis]|uniref:transmembrane protein 116 n=1 Tax=Cynoglossus semilaevis TaxID=244447 RepID=UPI0004970BCE|nr:transmembrane protein 116-like [Cynoglossus semilaevis]